MDTHLKYLVEKYPKPAKRLSYGTAGFREAASLPLHSVFLRMGILAAIRSRSVGAKCIGVMITASHNPECDNGIKIVDSNGGMLSQTWEPFAEALCNASSVEDLEEELQNISVRALGGEDCRRSPAVVIVGRDTRPHSAELAQCVREGAEAYGGTVFDLGEVTTPQLHFIVQLTNSSGPWPVRTFDPVAAIEAYYHTLGSGYMQLCSGADKSSSEDVIDRLVVDGSAGVGARAAVSLAAAVNSISSETLLLDVRNEVGTGPVNENCGAEVVQKGQRPPKGVSASTDAGRLLCSVDGDADRIVFHSFFDENTWVLFDGDKIASLVAIFLHQEVQAAGLDEEFSFGVVQTAYANGASTRFLRERGILVAMAKTGVKFVHHEAEKFDLGVYFEANGHGTAIFSDRLQFRIREWTNSDGAGATERVALAMQRLKSCLLLINQAVGDALSDMLLALACLRILKLTPQSWNALYCDLPSKQLKVPCANKSIISCSNDETRVLAPSALQDALDTAMSQTPQGRCFVRPSGTEDVVRVYAEAGTQEAADQLALQAQDAIRRILE